MKDFCNVEVVFLDSDKREKILNRGISCWLQAVFSQDKESFWSIQLSEFVVAKEGACKAKMKLLFSEGSFNLQRGNTFSVYYGKTVIAEGRIP